MTEFTMPEGWLVEFALVGAEGGPPAGDLVVAATRDDDTGFDLLLLDVSGHDEAAATMARELDTVLRGMLGQVAPEDLLAAANDELHNRDWGEGFATAVHLSLDLSTGDFALRGAAHPPPVRRRAASGRWRLLECPGPLLGLLPGASYDAVAGHLEKGDALLLYTDGMVEQPHLPIERGIVGLLRTAEEECGVSFSGLPGRLLSRVGRDDDDRALVLVQRR